MQQVARSAFASAVVLTDPARLPVIVRRARPLSVIGLQRIWVLRRRLFIRAGALVLVAAAIAIGFQYRGGIANTFGLVTDQAANGFSRAGLTIDQISITGQTLTDERTLIAALGIEENMPMVSFDAEAARARLEELPAVVSASVKKIYPSGLAVTITEKQPLARWRVDGVTFVIDEAGEQLAVVNGAAGDLPLLIGDGAADDAASIIEIISGHQLLSDRLIAMSRIADRRWDLIYDNGLRIMLPEIGVEGAMRAIERLDTDHQLLGRDLDIIDMRVDGQLAVRPTGRAVPDKGTSS
ncbi:MAG: FtsQ-type POTRA domain-containing protein [Cucumibacter sp.]